MRYTIKHGTNNSLAIRGVNLITSIISENVNSSDTFKAISALKYCERKEIARERRKHIIFPLVSNTLPK